MQILVVELVNVVELDSVSMVLPSSLGRSSQITSVEQIKKLVGARNGRDVLIWGEGASLALLDGYDGRVIVNRLSGKRVSKNKGVYTLSVASGERWSDVVEWSLEQGVCGLENLAGIPGTVGGAVINDIGAFGLDLSRFVSKISYICLASGEARVVNAWDCNFGSPEGTIFACELSEVAYITEVEFVIPSDVSVRVDSPLLACLYNPSPYDVFEIVLRERNRELCSLLECYIGECAEELSLEGVSYLSGVVRLGKTFGDKWKGYISDAAGCSEVEKWKFLQGLRVHVEAAVRENLMEAH